MDSHVSSATFCKDQDGNLVTDIKSTLDPCRAHFNAILYGDDTNNSANEMIRNNATSVAPSDREIVATAIPRLKCNKTSGYDGLPAELFKAGGDELVRCMHNLLCNIW